MAMKTKMLPHQKRSKSHPPTIGPMAMPTPVVAPHSPMALARSPRSVKTLTSNESVDGNMSAAPSPMTARAAMSSRRPRDRSRQARRGEHPQPDEQRALATQAVAQTPCSQDQGGEHQAVGVDDPLELGGGGPQAPYEGRQRDVHDRDVDADDESRQAQGQEDQGASLHAFLYLRVAQ